MTRIADIHSLHWQPALGSDGVVENADDIHQAIRIILRTVKGSDPLRPEFGSNLHLYIDYPVNRAKPHVVRECVDAIKRWEPRITVDKVEFYLAGESRAVVKVYWSYLSGGAKNSTEVRL
ncbi:MAG: baseplate protein [Burkholderiaceae bacterium]|nr:baseplate protein [Burkholderiaceae bacterium]